MRKTICSYTFSLHDNNMMDNKLLASIEIQKSNYLEL